MVREMIESAREMERRERNVLVVGGRVMEIEGEFGAIVERRRCSSEGVAEEMEVVVQRSGGGGGGGGGDDGGGWKDAR